MMPFLRILKVNFISANALFTLYAIDVSDLKTFPDQQKW